ncbi:MAG: DUF4421 domain-containing protein [Fibrobacter sp.]|nr:DUF4421 domain-containing protein [Fibrobacter sp.]
MFFRFSAALIFALSIGASLSFGAIAEFEKKFPLRFLCNYNFVSFWSSEFNKGAMNSNRPVDVGLGFGYRDLYFDFIYSLPFTTGHDRSKSVAFETGLDFFPGNWWLQTKYRRYSGFTAGGKIDENGDKSEDIFVDLWQRDMYLSALWMATADEYFTPRAAYFLDLKQETSAGSWIVGGRFQSVMAKDHSGYLPFYSHSRETYSTWVDLGYTYSWVYDNGMFINLWGVAGIAIGSDEDASEALLLPEVIAKMAWGSIGETWSWNMVMEMEYMPEVFDHHWEQKLVAAFKILVVRRF